MNNLIKARIIYRGDFMEGWIKIHRKILDNLIICKDSETFSIWLYLLLNATHQETSAIFKGKKIILKSGQLITGILSISKKLTINQNKVQRTLKCFETDKQIEQQTSNQNRLITILNWDKYQSTDKQNDKQVINKMINEIKKSDKQNDKQDSSQNALFCLGLEDGYVHSDKQNDKRKRRK